MEMRNGEVETSHNYSMFILSDPTQHNITTSQSTIQSIQPLMP